MPITQRIQFDIPYEAYLQLIRHPDCPGWRGKNKFFCQMLVAQVNAPEFKIRELEKENRRLAMERDQVRRELEQKVKNDEFLKRVQSGEFSRSLISKPEATETAVPATPSTEGRSDSVH